MRFEMNCENCGQTIKITEYGSKKICPFCGNPTMKVDIKEVHVRFGMNHSSFFNQLLADEVLDEVLHRENVRHLVGKDFKSIYFRCDLCIGDISNPPFSNGDCYTHQHLSVEGMQWGINTQFEEIDDLEDDIPVYFWVSDDDLNGFMNLLYFAIEFERFENIYLVKWIHTEKNFEESVYSMRDALNNKTKLTKNDLYDMRERYIEISGWNADYLVGDINTIEPWSSRKLEKYVLRCMDKNYRPFRAILSDVYDAIKKDVPYHVPYNMMVEVVHHLMLKGKIESHGACMWWGKYLRTHNVCLDDQSFRISTPKRKKYSYGETLDAVSEAFEYGYVYPLYRALNENSSITSGKKDYFGKKNIIKYIETSGAKHSYHNYEKICCDVIDSINNEMIPQAEWYVLLWCEKEGIKKYWKITVKCDDDGKIQNIAVNFVDK